MADAPRPAAPRPPSRGLPDPPAARPGGLADRLRERALAEGFAAMGVCAPDAIPEAPDRLRRWLADGMHGQMGWMESREAWRGDPGAMWPDARSVVMLAESYAPEGDPLEATRRPDRGAISVYARGRDYHDVVKKRLKRLGRWLLEQPEADGHAIKVFADTAPLMEKPLAHAAGLGWQGKHTNLLGRGIGNWTFLGAILTSLPLARDEPAAERCGSCTRCLDACPTDAFPAPFRLDARRCVSYLTIEHRGPVDEALRPGLGNRIYGCDDCLAVCPWNKFAVRARDQRLAARPELDAPPLAELAALTDAAFRERFSGSPIKRTGRDRFVRNVAYAIGNSGDPALVEAVRPLTDDPDAAVADAARWALARLAGRSSDPRGPASRDGPRPPHLAPNIRGGPGARVPPGGGSGGPQAPRPGPTGGDALQGGDDGREGSGGARQSGTSM